MQFTDKIEQYLEGEMTPEDRDTFENEIKTNPDLANEIRLHQLAIAGIQHKEKTEFQDFKSRMNALEETEEQVKETPVVPLQPNRSNNLRWLLGIAAMLLLTIGVYSLWFQAPSNPMESVTTELIAFNFSGTKGANSDSPKSAFQLGMSHFKNQEYQLALPLFDRTIQELPKKRAAAQFLKADALFRLGRKAEAKAVLSGILKADDSRLHWVANQALEKLQ